MASRAFLRSANPEHEASYVGFISARSRPYGSSELQIMSCEIVVGKAAMFVLWGKPSLEDVARVNERLQALVSEFGAPVTYITRVPADAPAPDAEVRKQLNAAMPRFAKLCSSYHVVLEGDGFVAAMKRGILTSLFQMGFRKGSFFVHSSAREIAYHVDTQRRGEVDEVLKLAHHAALLGNAWSSNSTARSA